MVYKRKYYKKKTKLDKYSDCAKLVAGDARYLASVIKPWLPFNAEYKHTDISTSVTPDNSGGTYLLNGMSQGTDNSDRIGRAVRVTNAEIRFSLTINASATHTRVRVMLIRQKQPKGVAISLSNVLNTVSVNSWTSWDDSAQFEICRDRIYNLSQDRPELTSKISCRPAPYKGRMKFDSSNNGDITDIETNAYWLCYVSDEATNVPTLSFASRVKYLDN